MKPSPPMFDEKMLTPDEALANILRYVEPLGSEVVDLQAALGRVVCKSLSAGRPLPPWDNSAMDGYAVRAAEVVPGQPLPVRGVVAAGHPLAQPLKPGTALRIMTGAPLPEGADAVIMREDAEEVDGAVRFRSTAIVGQHIRRAGEDIMLGDEVLAAGAVVSPGEIGLYAALGRSLVEVVARPTVAIISTGDELVPPDCQPGPGQIVNSNSAALLAQVSEAGAIGRVLPIVSDDKEALRRTFTQALQADIVVSSGGVSVGEFDYVREVLKELGAVEEFARVAMRPGKPVTFSRFEPQNAPHGRRRLFFGLPGNPASSMVSFELFVRPALRRLQGHNGDALLRPRALVKLAKAIVPDRTRLHFARARVTRSAEHPGELQAHILSQQGSGMLRSLVGYNALLHVPPGAVTLPAGSVLLASLLAAV